mgnify:CR=1 FL=1
MLSSNLEFCQKLWSAYREEADRHGPTVAPGQEAGWGGILVTAPSDAEAHAILASVLAYAGMGAEALEAAE